MSEAERELIIENARVCGLSVSGFLRTAGQFRQPKILADQQTLAALIHLESRIELLSRQLENLNIPPSDNTLHQLRQLCAKVSERLDQ
nr:hypothetical protein [Belnapia rosea]